MKLLSTYQVSIKLKSYFILATQLIVVFNYQNDQFMSSYSLAENLRKQPFMLSLHMSCFTWTHQ